MRLLALLCSALDTETIFRTAHRQSLSRVRWSKHRTIHISVARVDLLDLDAVATCDRAAIVDSTALLRRQLRDHRRGIFRCIPGHLWTQCNTRSRVVWLIQYSVCSPSGGLFRVGAAENMLSF